MTYADDHRFNGNALPRRFGAGAPHAAVYQLVTTDLKSQSCQLRDQRDPVHTRTPANAHERIHALELAVDRLTIHRLKLRLAGSTAEQLEANRLDLADAIHTLSAAYGRLAEHARTQAQAGRAATA